MQRPLIRINKALTTIRRRVRPSLITGSLVSLTLCALLSIITSYAVSATRQQIATAEPIRATAQRTAVATPSTTAQAGGPIKTCVPIGSTDPVALDLSGTPDGLQQQVDRPLTYQIYGASSATLRSQILDCAPKSAGSRQAEFTAETKYQLTWQYSYGSDGTNCRITQASVGIHVTQAMPLWQAPAGAQNGLASQWNSFMAALTTHENGHTALDVEYAQRLLNDLHSFPLTPCGQLAQAVKQLTDQDTAELAQANDTYDSTTNHGATQGAILP